MRNSIKNPKSASRRTFIKLGSAAGVGLALPGIKGQDSQKADNEKEDDKKNQSANGSGTFTILITADLHAQVHTHDEFFWENGKAVFRKRGGVAVLKTMIQQFKKHNPNTILYDGGDYFHGNALATLTEGEALIPVINAFEYDLILPGNWEVVYKKKRMLYDMGHATAAKICANMWHDEAGPENGELIYPPFWVRSIAGAKVGFIGYTDHLTPKRQSPAFSKGIRFEHAEKNIARYISYLKEVEGCGIIIVVTHMGLAQQVGLANNPAVEGADLIIGADTHERVRSPIEGKYTKVIECGSFGSFLGKLDLEVKDGKLSDMHYELLDVDPEKYPPDSAMEELVNELSIPYQKELSRVIGTTTTPLMRYFVMETPMDNLITDAIRWKCRPDIALSNGFRFCQPLAVSNNGIAEITKGFLWNMLPLDSEAKMGWVTGRQIMDWLEKELQNAFAKDPSKRFGGWFVRFSGMEVNFTIGAEFGKRLNWVKVNKVPLDPEKEYSIVACERDGDPDDTLCRIEKVSRPARMGLMLHEIVEEYLKNFSPVSPRLENRATATDAPATLLTQLQGTTYEFR